MNTQTKQPPMYYECGICDHLHPWEWNGDCREDAFRLTLDDVPKDAIIEPWERRLICDGYY